MNPYAQADDSFALFCNDFLRSQPWRHCITDLVYWICQKVNPHACCQEFKGNRDKVGRGVKLMIKGLAKAYQPNTKTGRWLFPVDDERYLEITKKQLMKFTGFITPSEYEYAVNVLIQAGVVQRKLASVYGRGRILKLRLNFDRLKELIDSISFLKREVPGSDRILPPPQPTDSRAEVVEKDNLVIVDTLQVNLGSNIDIKGDAPSASRSDTISAAGDLDSGKPETSSRVSDSSEEGKLSAEAEISPRSEKENTGPRGDDVWSGKQKLDPEGELILGEFQAFSGQLLTNDQVRKIQQLRNAPGFLSMTLVRVHHALSTLANHPYELPWAKGMTVDQILDRRTWARLARYADSVPFQDREMVEDDLKNAEERARTHVTNLLRDVISNPRKVEAEVELRKAMDKVTDWPALYLLGHFRQDTRYTGVETRTPARQCLLHNPLYFHFTRDLVDWIGILQLDADFVKKLEAAAESELSRMRWVVAQGRKYSR